MKLKYTFLSFFLLLSLIALPQDQKLIDSLTILIAKAPADSNKVNLIYTLGRQFDGNKSKKHLENFILALNLAKKLNYVTGEKKLYVSLISYLSNNQMYDLALTYGLEYVDFCEKQKMYTEKYGVYNMLGNLYTHVGRYEDAIKYYELKGKNDLEKEDYKSYASLLINMGLTYFESQDYNKALQPVLWSAQICKRNNMPSEMGNAILTAAKIYLKKEDLLNAEEKANEALNIYTANNERTGIANSLYVLGQVYAVNNKPDTAFNVFTKALMYADSLNLVTIKKDCYRELSDMYSRNKNYKESFEYQTLYKRYEDSIATHQQKAKMMELEVKYEVVTNENAFKDLELETAKKQKNMLVIGIVCLLMMLGVTYIRKKKR